ncbi:MAG: hypothetical protein EPO20_28200 [Betaproteobacteria bacterium]|nr:MAG: hypothetical protein EPO20_28200 [Betaproteobacteria bacterium]
MAVASLRWRFHADAVRDTPEQQGVFTLWDASDCVYIGHTPWNTTLRDRLRAYLELQEQGLIAASHFTWEATPTPKTREGDLLQVYLDKHGSLPRYNHADSPLRAAENCVTDLRARG